MSFDAEWQAILKKAWSIRFILLAGLLTGLEALAGPAMEAFSLPLWAMQSLTIANPIIIAAAFVARFVVQEGVPR